MSRRVDPTGRPSLFHREIGTETVALRVVEFPHASVARYVIV
jgi:hypothetical protein